MGTYIDGGGSIVRRGTTRGSAEAQRGAAAVELALILPILLSLVFGIISFGIIFAQQLSLGNGARQGARLGVVDDRTCDEIRTETQDAGSTIAMGAASIDVVASLGDDEATAAPICAGPADATVVPCLGSDPGDKLFVYASYQSNIPVPFVTTSVDLESVGVFRCEFQ